MLTVLAVPGAGDDHRVFPNCTAKAKGERNVMVGDQLLECRDIMSLNIRRPFDRVGGRGWSVLCQCMLWSSSCYPGAYDV